MIGGVKDKVTEAVFRGRAPKGFPADLEPTARPKLRVLDAARNLGGGSFPPRPVSWARRETPTEYAARIGRYGRGMTAFWFANLS